MVVLVPQQLRLLGNYVGWLVHNTIIATTTATVTAVVVVVVVVVVTIDTTLT